MINDLIEWDSAAEAGCWFEILRWQPFAYLPIRCGYDTFVVRLLNISGAQHNKHNDYAALCAAFLSQHRPVSYGKDKRWLPGLCYIWDKGPQAWAVT